MSWGMVAVAGATLVGSVVQSNAAKKAAASQSGAADKASQAQLEQYYQTREDQQPWMEVGGQSIRTIGDLLKSGEMYPNFTGADLTSEPGYEFRLAEGNKAINRAAKARGTYMGPSTVKELLRYGQDYASGEYQNAFNRDLTNKTTKFNMLSGAAGTGQTAANTLATAGTNTANNVGQLMTGAANARGAATIAGGNAFAGGANTIGGFYQQQQNRAQQQQWMDRMFPQQQTAPNSGMWWGNQ